MSHISSLRVTTGRLWSYFPPCGIERAHAQTVHSAVNNDFANVEVRGSNSYSTIVKDLIWIWL